ncbi:16S rRNA (guanine(966)-N(2))-methyltransferase RsmD [Sphingomonas sp. SUN039]|uniref:16S rRNA (guanine(966)-N(2))-methyltransferase RsmD n=1 Tax=Sphingomonas sp. SUN039 TaxID=2937787 RepID=UPI00216471BF|nr:16S rRNA (guanine(966)-N(2))-methyltransferase RsmD [Sphingomonas sp. SUN039]UVO52919.1 16S rRNA (guanine(966)-N(2))-methyltransferase RsmD [Sphingomonas sp. SUN039]
MRIISGNWRGRPLIAPKGTETRPTADRTREGLFSMLVSRLGSFEGLRVLDLFAGSGALGLEALSRGAATCTFVEQDSTALDALRTNIAKLGAAPQCDVRAQSVTALGPAPAPYDLVMLDPPYRSGAGVVALERCLRLGWLAPGALVTVETAKGEAVMVEGFEAETERVYGKAMITVLRTVQL